MSDPEQTPTSYTILSFATKTADRSTADVGDLLLDILVLTTVLSDLFELVDCVRVLLRVLYLT